MIHVFLLLVLISLSSGVFAKNLGTEGATFEILERDLLEVLQEKLQKMEASGNIERHQKLLVEVARTHLKTPKPVVGIYPATEHKYWTYDPTLIVSYDLKDHEGKVFHKNGTSINPLDQISLKHPLVFIDGREVDQITWIQNQKELFEQSKIILVGGAPFELMEAWGRPVYFDQGGILTQKLGLQAVPCVLRQKGRVLEIEEIFVKEGSGL